MKFGRVEGICVPLAVESEQLVRVTVYLETDMGIDIVREVEVEPEPRADGEPDLWWEADQWTQETIGTILAERGWEAIGAGDLPSPGDLDEPGALPRSAPYAVRNLSWG